MRATAVVLVGLGLLACGGGGDAGSRDFSLTVSPGSAPVLRDSGRWVEVTLTRHGSFAGDVVVTLASPPAGIASDVLTFTGDDTALGLRVDVDADVALGDVPVTLEARSGSGRSTSKLTLNVRAAEPTAREKIAAALAAGQLDLGTSLLYRCYARVGDDRLPAAFHGPSDEDLFLPAAVAAATPQLSADALAALHPYLVRPAQADSVWSLLPHAPRTPGQTTQPIMGWAAPAPSDCTAGNTWRSKRSASIPVRVWIECQDAISDLSEQRAMDFTLARLEKLWMPMTGLMGVPLADAGGPDEGGDTAIDVYLVQGAIDRGDATHDIYTLFDAGFVAYAAPSPPYPSQGSGHSPGSGYLVMPRIGITGEGLRITLTHELFHILQSAHNLEVGSAGDDEYWFVEASAVWAEVHYDRTLPWPARMAAKEHRGRFGRYQKGGVALNASKPAVHMYAGYIWPLFLEQLTGSDAFMGAIWRGLEPVTSFEQADRVLDQQGSFATHFHTFALRNLNASFLTGDPLPLEQRYHKLDDLFPDNALPPVKEYPPLTVGNTYTHTLDMPPLSSSYFLLTREGDGVRKVEIDLSGVGPSDSLDVEALIGVGGGWLDKPVKLTGESKVTFCFDKGMTTATVRGAFERMELVLSNHALQKDARIAGELAIRATDKPCGVWSGTAHSSSVLHDGFGTTITQTISANATLEVDPEASPDEIAFRLRGGDYTYRVYYDITNPVACRTDQTASGTMHRALPNDPAPGSSYAVLTIDPSTQPPGYIGFGSSWADVTEVSNCNDGHIDMTTKTIAMFNWWLLMGTQPFFVEPDGKTIQGTLDMPMGQGTSHQDWHFTKMDE